MKKITVHPDGSRTIHHYGPLPPERRPHDPTLDGRTLRYETLEHGGEYPDTMPVAIRVTDGSGRNCIYLPIQKDGQVIDPDSHRPLLPGRRPQDPTLHGQALRYQPLEHGPDNIPLSIRVTDSEGRSAVYLPIKEDGQIVDSLCFTLERQP